MHPVRPALLRGPLQAVRGPRAAKGWSWYQRYVREGEAAFMKARPPTPFDWTEGDHGRRRRAFLEMSVDGSVAGRVEVELATDVLPMTCENFLRLCRGDGQPPEAGKGEALGYAGTKMHRVVKGMGVMLGDVEGQDGAASHSSFGARFFHDEAFLIPHATQGLVSMASSGVHRNGSQFLITLEPAPQLDGRCVAFGRVTSGLDVVRHLYGLYSMRGRPVSDIRVQTCGQMS